MGFFMSAFNLYYSHEHEEYVFATKYDWHKCPIDNWDNILIALKLVTSYRWNIVNESEITDEELVATIREEPVAIIDKHKEQKMIPVYLNKDGYLFILETSWQSHPLSRFEDICKHMNLMGDRLMDFVKNTDKNEAIKNYKYITTLYY